MLLCVYMRATPYARRAVMSPPTAYTHSGSRHTRQASQAPVLYYKQKGSGGWVTKMDASSARKQPHATQARTRAGHSVNGTTRVPQGCRKSVKGCPSLNSYRSGTPRIEVCASASLRRHRLGTVQAPHHRHRHPARAPMLPALSCSCKPANVRRARYVSCTSCRTATHTLYSRAHMLRARTHSHAAHRATRM